MDTKTAARAFEDDVTALLSGRVARPDPGRVDENVQIAQQLVALGSEWRRLAAPSLRQKVAWLSAQAEHSLQQQPEPTSRVRRSLVRFGVATTAVATLLIVLVPAARHTVGHQMHRLLEIVRVGPGTDVARFDPMTTAESAAVVQQHDRAVAAGERWSVQTPYGGFGGRVPANASRTVQHVERLDVLRSLTSLPIQLPTGVTYRGRTPTFHHALVAPDGMLLLFFDSGEDEIFLMECPVGGGRAFTYTRVNVPELKTEQFVVNGQTVLWDPDPTGRWPESSALRWEREEVSYSLNARASLTRNEAVQLFLSLQPSEPQKPQ